MPMPISTTSVQDVKKAYQGNPGALQQRVGQAQQGGMPPKLIELMALQEIQEMLKNTQVAQQLGNGAQQMPTVAEKLQGEVMAGAREKVQQQMGLKAALAGRQQQAQQELMKQASARPGAVPEGTPQPQEQPKAEGLDRLRSNLGEFYSGGIVAFEGGGDVESKKDKYETRYDRMNRLNREAREGTPEDNARREQLLSQIPTDGMPQVPATNPVTGSELERNIMNTLSALPGASVARVPSAVGRAVVPANARMGLASVGEGIAAARDALTPKAAPAPAPRATQADVRKIDNQIAKDNPAAMRGVTPAPVRAPAPAPTAGARQGIAASAATKAVAPGVPAAPADSLEGDLVAHARRAMKPVDEEATRAGESERYRRETGIDAILKSREDRARKLEELQAKQAAGRDKWGEFIYAMDPYARGGFGPGVTAGGRGLRAAQGRWSAEDKANLEQMNKIRDEIDAARLSGNTGAYNAGLEKLKTAQEAQQKAATIGANVFGTQSQAAVTREGYQNQLKIAEIQRRTALEAAQLRVNAAGTAGDKQRLNELKALSKSLNDQLKDMSNMKQFPTIRAQLKQVDAEIAQMAGMDTMPVAPGAQGPGGTTAGWGKAQIVKP